MSEKNEKVLSAFKAENPIKFRLLIKQIRNHKGGTFVSIYFDESSGYLQADKPKKFRLLSSR